METRIKNIYGELYQGVKSKKYFAALYGVTTKTVENTIAKVTEDIVYDKKLGGYRFSSLLPKYIPHDIFFKLLQHSVSNEIVKHDFYTLSEMIKEKEDINLPMVPTSTVSSLAQKIIMLEVAIRSNCIIEIDYLGNDRPLEKKYIRPHKINTSENSYYLYGSYDKRNERDVGCYRSLAVNGMHTISPIAYVKEETFYMNGIGNAYGIITKEKSITLMLEGSSANYFKRERQFNKEQFDFISEEVDGSVLMKMYYNNLQEVVMLLQQWMPFISIEDTKKITEEVYAIIQKNTKRLMNKRSY